MPLRSNLFRGDKALEACLIQDRAHVTPGATGLHVAKIQAAIMDLDGVSIQPTELSARRYGPSTATAVLAYKTKRKIVNHAYQTQADNIVGKMTVAAIDKELLGKQDNTPPPFDRRCNRV